MVQLSGWILALVALASATAAQGTIRPYDPPPESYRSPQEGVEPARPVVVQGADDRVNELEIGLNDDAFWLGFRRPLRRGEGYLHLEVFGNDDDDYMLSARLMRFGSPSADSPLSFGVGIGGHAAWIDEPMDADAYAISLAGHARYAFPTDVPTFLGVDLSFAPEVTSFDDGEELLDFSIRAEAEISSFATAFVGYRTIEIELDDGSDRELDEQVHAGVRLGF